MMDIYACRVTCLTHEQLQDYLQAFNARNRARIAAFRDPWDACRTISARLLLGQVAKIHLGREFCDEMLAYHEYGKPFLPEYPSFHFNLAHSGHWAVCVVDGQPAGIDIEKVLPLDYPALARQVLDSEELLQLASKSGRERLDYFYSLWTVKESYLKALGMGLSLPLDSFTATLAGDRGIIQPRGANTASRPMQVRQYKWEQGYQMAACAEHSHFPDEITILGGIS